MRDGNGMVTDLALGAAAGLAATWVMGRVTSYMYEHEDSTAREEEDAARGGRTAYGVAAEKVASAARADLSDEQIQKLGSRIHWVLGMGAGAAYGVLRRRLPSADAAQGLVFGTTFWGLIDEGANTALRLTPGPTAFPWQAHVRGLAGHLVFGLVTETILDAADRLFD